MSSASQSMLCESLFMDQDIIMSSQLGIFPFQYPNFTSLPLGCSQPLKTLATITPSLTSDLPPTLSDHHQSIATKQVEGFAGSQILSLQRSTANYREGDFGDDFRAWGELSDCINMKRSGGDDHLAVSTSKMKKIKGRRKVRDPRFCFKTMSDVDILDDGYKWRKYGQKVVKNTLHPRSYYRCTQDNCRVKKRIERLAEDPRMVITTYEGRHIHSPSQNEEDSQASSQINNFFW